MRYIMRNDRFRVTGMTCAACQANVTRAVKKLDGVSDVNVSLLAGRMTVQYDETKLDAARIAQAVKDVGYGAEPENVQSDKGTSDFRTQWRERQQASEQERSAMGRRLVWSLVLLVPLMYLAMGGMIGLPMPWFFDGVNNALPLAFTQFLLSLIIIAINRKFYTVGFKALVKFAPNMDSLVAIGSSASLLYGVFAMFMMMYGLGNGDMARVHQYAHELYFESAAMILALVTVGKYLEARSKAKTSSALDKLVDLAPKTAIVLRDGVEREVEAESLLPGDIVVIKPGMSIPADGEIIEGNGFLDQAAITGESMPVEKNIGDTVITATINRNGSFKMRTSRVGADTTLAQIIRLVDDAGNSKAPIARLADRVSGVFVPIVILIAIATAVIWLWAGYGFEHALSCAISVLVISCPCALGLATPVAIMVGTGKAAEIGILIKSAESLETLHSVDTIVLDKTGTITSGHPAVTDVVMLAPDMTEQELIQRAAALESGSEHPLATAIVEYAASKHVDVPEASSFAAEAGLGVRAEVDGRKWLAGSAAFMEQNDCMNDDRATLARERMAEFARQGKTPLLFAVDSALAGIIAVADTVRESSLLAIEEFKKRGLHVVMLTGDNATTAEAIRAQLGIEQAIADVLPADKEAHVRALKEQGRRVAMVGDGINDAPALKRADVGIAIGAGADIAIESADVVLMKNSLLDVARAIELSQEVIRNIHMNLFWAFFYNVLGIPIAAGALFVPLGLKLSPMIGSAAMSLSSVCVVSNALRLRWFKGSNADGEPREAVRKALRQPNGDQASEVAGDTTTQSACACAAVPDESKGSSEGTNACPVSCAVAQSLEPTASGTELPNQHDEVGTESKVELDADAQTADNACPVVCADQDNPQPDSASMDAESTAKPTEAKPVAKCAAMSGMGLISVDDENDDNNGNEPSNRKEGLTMKKVISVEGMMCAHCQAHVEKALKAVDGVTAAEVSLEAKNATVTLSKDVADQVLMDAVTEAGYTPTGCKTI